MDHTPDSIFVRKAEERDYPAMVRIQMACPEAAQWPLGDYSRFETLVAFLASEPVGFCAWRQSAPDEAELLNLAVDPAHHRKGVASALLRALLETARGDIFLEVAEPNLPAIFLYKKHGWSQIGMRPGYYHAGKINGIVMKKRSWYSPG
ncbi:MAG: GNAT family N-acetyltransferase [Acidobacteriota bacterium]|nr:GNAT family N-acetyltransferase [Acidobacteriota bacterium]